jgi:hypothetical protein
MDRQCRPLRVVRTGCQVLIPSQGVFELEHRLWRSIGTGFGPVPRNGSIGLCGSGFARPPARKSQGRKRDAASRHSGPDRGGDGAWGLLEGSRRSLLSLDARCGGAVRV